MVRPVCGFFFSRLVLSAQPVDGAHTIELADTHTEIKALSHQALDFAACGRHVILAVIQHTGEHLSLKLRGMAVAPLSQCLLTFALDTLEEPNTRSCDAWRQSSVSVLLVRSSPLAQTGQALA